MFGAQLGDSSVPLVWTACKCSEQMAGLERSGWHLPHLVWLQPGLRQDSWPDYHRRPQDRQISGCRGPWVAAAGWPPMSPPRKSLNILPPCPARFEGQVMHGPHLSGEVCPGRCGCAFDLPHLASRCMTSQGPRLLMKLDILLRGPAQVTEWSLSRQQCSLFNSEFFLADSEHRDLNYFQWLEKPPKNG